jgi:mannose-1-phosphate guanylyltransferase/mannose-6-phosphate isomerase
MVILSSDHHIAPVSEFVKCIDSAVQYALQGYFCTIGIKPTHPATGFGYIKMGKVLKNISGNSKAYIVENFREKPNVELALDYLSKGNYLWNSGIFVWKAEDFWSQLKVTQPELCAFFESNSEKDIQKNYHKLPNVPIDIAFLEKTKNIACIPSTFYWDDVGSWSSVFSTFPKASGNNLIMGDVIQKDTTNSLVISNSKKQSVATLGLDNQAVIVTDDVILVMPLNKAQDIKSLISQMKKQKRIELL